MNKDFGRDYAGDIIYIGKSAEELLIEILNDSQFAFLPKVDPDVSEEYYKQELEWYQKKIDHYTKATINDIRQELIQHNLNADKSVSESISACDEALDMLCLLYDKIYNWHPVPERLAFKMEVLDIILEIEAGAKQEREIYARNQDWAKASFLYDDEAVKEYVAYEIDRFNRLKQKTNDEFEAFKAYEKKKMIIEAAIHSLFVESEDNNE